MNKLKKVLSAVVDASNRPAEGWRLLRQAVRELHVVLQGVTSLVAEFEARLDRLEMTATQRPAPKARSKTKSRPRSNTATATNKAAPRKTARKSRGAK